MFVSPTDFVLNGQGSGPVGELMSDIQYDVGLMRPFFDENGNNCVLVNTHKKAPKKKADGTLITNSDGSVKQFPIHEKRLVADLAFNHGMMKLVQNATVFTKEQWVTLTNIVRTAYRSRLRAWSDLMARSSYGGFDGMSTMMLEYQTMSDPGEAVVDFDGMTEGRTDAPLFKLEGLPLPITHADFFFSERQLAISRKGGTGLNTRMVEAKTRRIAEMVERTLIGTVTGPTLGSAATGAAGIPYGRAPSVYGYTNHPARITSATLTRPTSGGWSPDVLVGEILAAIELLRGQNFFGPFMVYTSTDWDTYLDNDYYKTTTSGAVAPTKTLRERLRAIDEVADIKRLDFFTGTAPFFQMVIVSMTPDVVQAVNGMDINVIQWPSMGGMRTNFKVMCIHAPLITPDYNDRCGILHATAT